MKVKTIMLALGFLVSLCCGQLWAGQSTGQGPAAYGHGNEIKLPNGVIGVVVEVAAERIGEPAALYVIRVHQDGPAEQAGVRHGDEIVAVNGTPVMGKSYEQVVSMIRGEAGTPVKLEIRGTRELSLTRVAAEKFKGDGQYGLRERQGEPVRP